MKVDMMVQKFVVVLLVLMVVLLGVVGTNLANLKMLVQQIRLKKKFLYKKQVKLQKALRKKLLRIKTVLEWS